MDITVRARAGYNWWLVLGSVIALYLIINLVLPRVPIEGTIKAYVFQPLLWGLLIGAVLKVFPRYRPAAKLKVKPAIIQLALMIGFFQILLYVVGGLFGLLGFSRVISFLFKNYRMATLSFILGLMIGALRKPGEFIIQQPENTLITIGAIILGMCIVGFFSYYEFSIKKFYDKSS